MKVDRTRLFDKRVVQRNIRAGRVTKDEYRAWLGDQSDTREKIMPREEGGDDDGYEIVPKAPISAVPAALLSPAHAAAAIVPAAGPTVVAAPAGAPAVAPAPASAPAAEPVSAPEPPTSDQAG